MKDPRITLRDFRCLGCKWVRYKKGIMCQCFHPLVTSEPIPLIAGRYKGHSAREKMEIEIDFDKVARIFPGRGKRGIYSHPMFRWPWHYLDAVIAQCAVKEIE